MPTPIYFHGAGLCTTQGNTIQQNILALTQPKTPQIIDDHIDQEPIQFPYFGIKNKVKNALQHLHQTIDSAIEQALQEADLNTKQISELGLFIGSTSFDIGCAEALIANSDGSDNIIAQHTPPFTNIAHYIQQRFDIAGPIYSFNTACTASANALIYAAGAIRSGEINQALVVGIELYNRTTSLGFHGLQLITRCKSAMRPFCAGRDGLILGEGCGALLISKEKKMLNDNSEFAFIAGANQTDTFSITSCNPDGSSIAKVINQSLGNAKIKPTDIQCIKTHGTASLSNDDAEAAGLIQVFLNKSTDKIPPIIALKPLLGHTLGACGITELILFYRALNANVTPTLSIDYDIDKNFPLNFLSPKQKVQPGYYLLNYFGFGGNNTTLIISNKLT